MIFHFDELLYVIHQIYFDICMYCTQQNILYPAKIMPGQMRARQSMVIIAFFFLSPEIPDYPLNSPIFFKTCTL